MYIVTIDNPYYPTVEYCDSKEEAEEVYKTTIKDMAYKHGDFECHVVIAKIELKTSIKTDY